MFAVAFLCSGAEASQFRAKDQGALATATATATATVTQTSFQNRNSHYCNHFLIILALFHCEIRALKFGERMKCFSSGTDVLHRPLIVIISRCCCAEDDKEMYQHVKRTCKACRVLVFAHRLFCSVLVAVAVVFALLFHDNADKNIIHNSAPSHRRKHG